MKLICVGEEKGFTIGNEYQYKFLKKYSWRDWWILIRNDSGVEVKMVLNQFIITMLPPSDIWVEYISDGREGLTRGKYYNLLERGSISLNDEHYYFLDDNNKFIGAFRGRNFRDVSKTRLREIILNKLLSMREC
jgi:hypothetical protein